MWGGGGGEGGRREDNEGRTMAKEEKEQVGEEEKRGSQERRGRAGCYLSHHKAVITFSLPDRSLATLLVAVPGRYPDNAGCPGQPEGHARASETWPPPRPPYRFRFDAGQGVGTKGECGPTPRSSRCARQGGEKAEVEEDAAG